MVRLTGSQRFMITMVLLSSTTSLLQAELTRSVIMPASVSWTKTVSFVIQSTADIM